MSDNTNLLIVESMQLAIVALIVIICIFNPRLAIIKNSTSHDAPGFFDVFFRNFIALGFVANLVYILCNLGQSKLVGWFDENGLSGVVATIADIFTASAFLYGSLEGRVNKKNKWILGGSAIVLSILFVIFNFRKEHVILHLYSLATYSAVSIYVFRQIGEVEIEF